MNIALIGYGKMGKLVEQLAPAEIKLRLDEFNNASYEGITRENFQGIDVAIDFSIPGAAVENLERSRLFYTGNFDFKIYDKSRR